MFRGGFLILYPKSYPKKVDVIPQKNHLESNDDFASRKTLFLVKRKTGLKAAPYEPVSSHLLMPAETGFTKYKTV